MKTLFVIMLVLGTVAAAGAAFDLTGWSWQRSIPVQATSGFVRLSVPPEVFDQSEAGLNDLRVLDDSNKLVPHVIHWGRVRVVRHLEWLKARLLNAT
jgi:lipase chaperone LimK